MQKSVNIVFVEQLQSYTPTLIAVTKNVGVLEMEALYTCGVRHFGEHRVDPFLEKVAYFNDRKDIVWHYIGPLQRKQVKKVISHIDYYHALSSVSVAKEIEKHAVKKVACFLQVNCSGEVQKHGVSKEEVVDVYTAMNIYEHIDIVGCMTMAAHTEDISKIKQTFQSLRMIRNQLNPTLKLSMGMSNDYRIAIEEGSDFLRIGTALFDEVPLS